MLPSIGYCPRVLQTAPGSAAPPARPPCWAEAGGWVRSLPVLGLRTVLHRDNSLHGLLIKYKCYDAATVGCDGDFQKDAACLCVSQGQSLVSWLAKKFAKVRTKVKWTHPAAYRGRSPAADNVQCEAKSISDCVQQQPNSLFPLSARFPFSQHVKQLTVTALSTSSNGDKRSLLCVLTWYNLIAIHCHLPSRHTRNMI